METKNIKQLRNNANKAAVLLKALAHPARLMILCQLVEAEKTAGDLWQNSDLSQSAFSQHLAVLRKDGLVKTRKESQTVFYSLVNKHSMKVVELMHELYCK